MYVSTVVCRQHETSSLDPSEFHGPGVGVTKPIFSVLSLSLFFTTVKTKITLMISRAYLTGIIAAQLRRHLLTMFDCDWKYQNYTIAKSFFSVTEKWTNGALVTPIPGKSKYIVERTGPNTDPCGTPYITFAMNEYSLQKLDGINHMW